MTRQRATSNPVGGDRSQILEDARTRWLDEEKAYYAFGSIVLDRLLAIARSNGIKANVDSRLKSVDSLIKKLIRKPDHTYETVGDKVGARVIVRRQREVDEMVGHLKSLFLCSEPDDKSEALGENRVGYQSVHVEVRLRDEDQEAGHFPAARFCAEVQVRTLGQHLWSEMSHDVTYKGGVELPTTMRRRVHLLAGLIEVADNEFSRLDEELKNLPDMPEATILEALERQYYRLTSRQPDRALSLDVIKLLRPLYDAPPADWCAYFQGLLQEKREFFGEVFSIAEDNPQRSAFLFQPEILMIYDQLHKDPDRLRETWAHGQRAMAAVKLEDLANAARFTRVDYQTSASGDRHRSRAPACLLPITSRGDILSRVRSLIDLALKLGKGQQNVQCQPSQRVVVLNCWVR